MQKSGFSFSFTQAETEVSNNRIVFRPVITIYGSFHSNIGKLVVKLLYEQISAVVADLAPLLALPAKEVSDDD